MSAWRTEFQVGVRALREFNRSLAVPAGPKLAAVRVAAPTRGGCPISSVEEVDLDTEPGPRGLRRPFDR